MLKIQMNVKDMDIDIQTKHELTELIKKALCSFYKNTGGVVTQIEIDSLTKTSSPEYIEFDRIEYTGFVDTRR
jgi:hypothetical protein